MSALSKEAAGISALLILFLQYANSLIILVSAALGPRIIELQTEHLALQIFRSVAGSVCQLLFFVAVRSIPLLVAVLLSNAAPLFILIVVYIWFNGLTLNCVLGPPAAKHRERG
jgi:drug/metabolite transporter (DMT)-like permease